MNFAESALKGYLKELARTRQTHERMTSLEIRVSRVRLASLITARMIELNGAWNPFEDIRLTWAFEFGRFSEEGGSLKCENEDAILYLITGDTHPASHSQGRGCAVNATRDS